MQRNNYSEATKNFSRENFLQTLKIFSSSTPLAKSRQPLSW
jgi:hypothetical protein